MGRPKLSHDERALLQVISTGPASQLRHALDGFVRAIGYRGVRHVLSKGRLVAEGQRDEFRARAHRARLDVTRFEQAKELLGSMEEGS